MKSLLIAFLMAVSVFSTKAQAQDAPASIRNSFISSFPFASNINWSKAGNFHKAEFVQDDEKLFAFFNNAGELVVVARYIQLSKLPQPLRTNLVKQFAGYTVTEVFEVEDNQERKFYATLERNGISIILQSLQNTRWQQFTRK